MVSWSYHFGPKLVLLRRGATSEAAATLTAARQTCQQSAHGPCASDGPAYAISRGWEGCPRAYTLGSQHFFVPGDLFATLAQSSDAIMRATRELCTYNEHMQRSSGSTYTRGDLQLRHTRQTHSDRLQTDPIVRTRGSRALLTAATATHKRHGPMRGSHSR